MSKVGIAVNTADNKVVIDFSEKVDHLEFTPQEAGEFAKAIIEKAMRINGVGSSPIIVPAALKGH